MHAHSPSVSSLATWPEEAVRRTRLAAPTFGLAETLDVTGPRCHRPGRDDYSPCYQVCLPYRGAFVWHVGRDDVLADPNRVVFVTGDEPFRMSRPVEGGYAELIVTVATEMLCELMGTSIPSLPRAPVFRDRSRPASLPLQRLGATLVHTADAASALGTDERLILFVRAALECPDPRYTASPSTRRLVSRAKAYLADHVSGPIQLQQVAHAVGTTPAYLTTLFRQLEGQPLHKYLVQLRLARALVELPHTTDITTLAADLGFASHSHFSAVFRRAFGCTPSSFRAATRPVQHQVVATWRRASTTVTATA